MVECGFQDLVGEILEREKLAYRDSVENADFRIPAIIWNLSLRKKYPVERTNVSR